MSGSMFQSIGGLERVLDYHLQRHGVLASNVTNAETPRYRPKDLIFNDSMKKVQGLAGGDKGHIGVSSKTEANYTRVEYGPTSVDQNGVRVERAMARLTANKLRYNSSVEVLRRRLALIKYAASDR